MSPSRKHVFFYFAITPLVPNSLRRVHLMINHRGPARNYFRRNNVVPSLYRRHFFPINLPTVPVANDGPCLLILHACLLLQSVY